MINHTHENPYAKILAPRPSISRRCPPRNNFRKKRPFHGARSQPSVPTFRNGQKNANHTNHQSHAPTRPIPSDVDVSRSDSKLLDYLEKAANPQLIKPCARSPDRSRGSNANQGHVFKPATAPYQSVSTLWNSRRSLSNSHKNSSALSTSSKVDMTTSSSKVMDKYKSTPYSNVSDVNSVYKAIESRNVPPSSKNYPPKHVANAREATHQPSQVRPESLPRAPSDRRTGSPQKRTRAKPPSPSSPKNKPSPIHTTRRNAHPPPSPTFLESPQSPQQPSLNRNAPKPQIRRSTKHDIQPERASRPEEPVFPLSHSRRKDLSPLLRKSNEKGTPLSSPGVAKDTRQRRVQFGNNVVYDIPRIGTKKVNGNSTTCRQPQLQKNNTVEIPGMNFSPKDDIPLAQAFGRHARPRGEQDNIKTSRVRPSTVNNGRQSVVNTSTPKPTPPPPPQSPTKSLVENRSPECKADAKAPKSHAVKVMGSASLQTIKETARNSISRDQSTRLVPPIKKRRVVEKGSSPRPSHSAPVSKGEKNANRGQMGLDLKTVQDSQKSKSSADAGVSPVSITEAPFDFSFEDPAIAELRKLNISDNRQCLLGTSMKTASRNRPHTRSRHCLSFERTRQKLSRPVYIADPQDQRVMEEVLAAVYTNVKLEKQA